MTINGNLQSGLHNILVMITENNYPHFEVCETLKTKADRPANIRVLGFPSVRLCR